MLKRMAKIFAVAVMICCSLLFGACDEKPRRGIDEGRVYGVSFETGVEGLNIDAQVISEGERVIEPGVPLRPGYKFVGWKVDGVFWNFSSSRVFSSFELVAVWEIDSVSWAYTDGLQFAYNETTKNYDVVGYSGLEENVVLPLYYNGEKGGASVGVVADSAFAGNTAIKKIVLSSNVGASAFAGSSIEEVEFSVASVVIGASAFSGTTNLKTVIFKNSPGNVVIGASAFAGSGIESIILPDSLTEIGASAFAGSSIRTVKFGSLSTLNSIGASAFYNTKLERVALPSSVETVGDNAFMSNAFLKNIVFPSGVKSVGVGIFDGCGELGGIYFTGQSKSKALIDSAYWNSLGINEYFYSDYDKGVPGCWRGFNNAGDPIAFIKNTDFTIDLNGISDYLSGDISDYKVVVRAYFVRRVGVYSHETQVLYFDNNLSTVAIMDTYKIVSYSIEVFSVDDVQLESADALCVIYDLKIDQTHIIATGVNTETKTIII